MSVSMEDNYRALLEKLVRMRARHADRREAFKAAADDHSLPFGNRAGAKCKARTLGGIISELDFMIARNRQEIAAFGIDESSTGGPS